jgi:hydrophobic/amphiphilic exporter-1 (mainly G- bacteria), HAE1 family
VQVAAGQVGQQPARAGQTYQISVRAVGRLSSAQEFENVILKRGRDGALVRIKDVGRAELGAENYASALRYNGVEAVGVGVSQLPTANALDVRANVVAELDRLAERFPPGMKYRLAFDTTTVVSESIREVLRTLAEAIALVILVMFLFLQSWRTTLIPMITIPVSLVGAFAFVKAFDFSINTLTLFGIVLATGLVVDDAIVVIENIERHMREEKRKAREAASVAMGEVFGAVLATGLVLSAVFIPVAFFPGTTGRLYQQFALTIAFSMLLSVFNAVTLDAGARRAAAPRAPRELVLPHRQPRHRCRHGVLPSRAARPHALAPGVVVTFLVMLGVTYWVYHEGADRLRARWRIRASSSSAVQAPEGASLAVHERRHAAGGAVLEPDARGGRRVHGGGLQLRRLRLEPRSRVRAPEAVRRAAGRRASRHRPCSGGCSARSWPIPGAQIIPFLPPSIQGVGAVRRVPVPGARPDRQPRHRPARGRDARDGHGRGTRRPACRGSSRSSRRTTRSCS